jgi:hypothetical protein
LKVSYWSQFTGSHLHHLLLLYDNRVGEERAVQRECLVLASLSTHINPILPGLQGDRGRVRGQNTGISPVSRDVASFPGDCDPNDSPSALQRPSHQGGGGEGGSPMQATFTRTALTPDDIISSNSSLCSRRHSNARLVSPSLWHLWNWCLWNGIMGMGPHTCSTRSLW